MVAMQILRKMSEESPLGSCLTGGAFIRPANRELAQAFMTRMNGLSHRGLVIRVQQCQEFPLRDTSADVNLLGTQRFFRDVWKCPLRS